MSEQTQTQESQETESQTSGGEQTAENKPTFDEQVSNVSQRILAGEEIKDVPPEVASAAKYKAEAEQEKAQREAAQAEAAALKTKVNENPESLLTQEQVDELDSLKAQDPDAWFAKKNQYIQEAKAKVTSVSESDKVAATLEAAITIHNQKNPKMLITKESLKDDIPPRMLRELEAKRAEGKITASEFVRQITDFLAEPKKVGGVSAPDTGPNLNEATGGEKVPATAADESVAQKYEKSVLI